MQKQIKNNSISAVLIILLIVALLGVRAFERQLFSDPLLDFYKYSISQKALPLINFSSLIANYLFRYFLNSTISVAIIFVVFRSWKQIKFASILYVLFFIILMVVMLALLCIEGEQLYLIIFYIRRFIIQPLFLILFLPAFYYQKLLQKRHK